MDTETKGLKKDILCKDREPQNHTLFRGTYLYSPYIWPNQHGPNA